MTGILSITSQTFYRTSHINNNKPNKKHVWPEKFAFIDNIKIKQQICYLNCTIYLALIEINQTKIYHTSSTQSINTSSKVYKKLVPD